MGMGLNTAYDLKQAKINSEKLLSMLGSDSKLVFTIKLISQNNGFRISLKPVKMMTACMKSQRKNWLKPHKESPFPRDILQNSRSNLVSGSI